MFRVAWFRFRATFARRRSGYLSIVLLIGLVGGLALGVLAGARRTQSSFPAFLKSTNPSDLSIFGLPPNADGTLLDSVAHLPHVKHVESYGALYADPIQPNGAPTRAALALKGFSIASIDGLGFDQDRLTATQGRLADPRRPDEIVMNAERARALGIHLGETLRIGVFTNAQTELSGFGSPNLHPARQLTVTLVGLVKFNNTIVQDDVDAGGNELMIFTPAFTRPLTKCCNLGLDSGFQLDRGARDVSAVEAEIERMLPKGSAFYVHVTSVFEAQAERAIKPEAVALGVFGIIAALATLLIAGQVIGRQLRLDTDDLDALRAIGAGPAMTTADGLIGVVGAVTAGSVLAIVIAIALSPLAPIGPTRRVYPFKGIAFDWTVLGLGFAALVVVLTAAALALASQRARHRSRVSDRPARRGSVVARTAAAAGLPASTVAGIRFALESGRGRNPAPVRSAIVGAVLAIVVVTGTLTFGTSLRTLVSHPALYGWNWDDEILTNGGGGDIPMSAAHALLDHDHDVAAWSGVYFDSLRIDGQTVPILGAQPSTPVQPPILTGHGLEANDQLVLGANTLAQLHKHVGDWVEANYGAGGAARLQIVGTATMPAVGPADQLHLSIATGALVSYRDLPAEVRNSGGDGLGDSFAPNAIFVRLRRGADPTAALKSLRRAVAAKTGAVSVVSVQRPAEIVNYRSMGATPALLGAALAVGSIAALALTLIASVRRRQRDLALLKALGFTRRQLAGTVAWQSTIAVGVGVVVGVPLGIVAGRELWTLFAHELHVVPQVSVPALTLFFVAIGALVLANVIAAVPGYQAARTPTALLLRAE